MACYKILTPAMRWWSSPISISLAHSGAVSNKHVTTAAWVNSSAAKYCTIELYSQSCWASAHDRVFRSKTWFDYGKQSIVTLRLNTLYIIYLHNKVPLFLSIVHHYHTLFQCFYPPAGEWRHRSMLQYCCRLYHYCMIPVDQLNYLTQEVDCNSQLSK